MSRAVFEYQPTWKDRQFIKAFNKLPGREQEDFVDELQQLITALASAPHPATDAKIKQRYKAKSYEGVVKLAEASLIEYSLGKFSRVIAKYPAAKGSTDILLLAVSLSHDHPRLKDLIKRNRSGIDGWIP